MSKGLENTNRLLKDISARNIHVDSFPILMFVESVKGCPCSCIMCGNRNTSHKDISSELLTKIEPFFKYLEVLAIHGDGEALLSRKIDFFIDASRKNNCMLHIDTTGLFLTPMLAEKLLSARLSMTFSIHSGTAETYKKIMGGNLDRTIKNISYLMKKNMRIGSEANRFKFSFIVMKENIGEIDDFLNLADSVGIKKVRFMQLRPNAKTIEGVLRRGVNFRFLFHEQFNEQIRKLFFKKLLHIETLAKKLDIEVESDGMESVMRTRGGICLAPWAGEVQIGQNGDVKLCCSSNYIIGNIYKQDFDKIWNSEKIKYIRKKLNEGHFPRLCGTCNGRQFNNYTIKPTSFAAIVA